MRLTVPSPGQTNRPDPAQAREEKQCSPGKREQHRLAEIGLLHEQNDGKREQGKGEKRRRHFRPPPALGERPGDEHDKGGLQKFRRLQTHAEKIEPAARALDFGADEERGSDEHKTDQEDGKRDAPDLARRQRRGREQDGERRQQKKRLPVHEIERIKPEPDRDRGACSEKKHDPDQHQCEHRADHQPVDGPPPFAE